MAHIRKEVTFGLTHRVRRLFGFAEFIFHLFAFGHIQQNTDDTIDLVRTIAKDAS